MSRVMIGYRFLVWSSRGGPDRATNRSGVKLLTAINCRFSRRSLNQLGAANSTRTLTIPAIHPAAMSSFFFISSLPEGRYQHHRSTSQSLIRFSVPYAQRVTWPSEQGPGRCGILRAPTLFCDGRNLSRGIDHAVCFVCCFFPCLLRGFGLLPAIARGEDGSVGEAGGWPRSRGVFSHRSVVRRGGIENSAPGDGTFAARGKSATPD